MPVSSVARQQEELVTVSPDTPVQEVADLMRERSIRRLPVVEDGELVGIVTLDDLLVLLDDEMSDLSEVIRAESPPWEAA